MAGSGAENKDDCLDISSIHATWDSTTEIRSRLRDGSTFLHPRSESKTDNNTCCLNKPILLPIVEKMSKSDRKLPGVGDLRAEMTACYTANKRVDNPDDAQAIIWDSWHIRKLLSHIKAKARRGEVSTESFLIVGLFSLLLGPFVYLLSISLALSLSLPVLRVFRCCCEPEDPEFQEFCVLLDPGLQAPSQNHNPEIAPLGRGRKFATS